ncbi:hypothetical protein pb186bvf_013173 [Paramecium bursaria]
MLRKVDFQQDSFQIYGSDGYDGTFINDELEQSQPQYDDFSYDQQENEADDANKTTESLGGGEMKTKQQEISLASLNLEKNNQDVSRRDQESTQESMQSDERILRYISYISLYLESIFTSSQIQQNSALRSFMNKSKQKCGKEDLDHFLGTSIGRQIGNMFYGNLKFTGFFVKENKVNLDSYFRILDEYFLPNKEIEP